MRESESNESGLRLYPSGLWSDSSAVDSDFGLTDSDSTPVDSDSQMSLVKIYKVNINFYVQ